MRRWVIAMDEDKEKTSKDEWSDKAREAAAEARKRHAHHTSMAASHLTRAKHATSNSESVKHMNQHMFHSKQAKKLGRFLSDT